MLVTTRITKEIEHFNYDYCGVTAVLYILKILYILW